MKQKTIDKLNGALTYAISACSGIMFGMSWAYFSDGNTGAAKGYLCAGIYAFGWWMEKMFKDLYKTGE